MLLQIILVQLIAIPLTTMNCKDIHQVYTKYTIDWPDASATAVVLPEAINRPVPILPC